MTSENNVTVHVRLKFGNFIHANRLYRASTSSDYIGRPLIGFISLFFGGCYWIFIAAQPARPQNGIDLSFPIASVLILLGFAFIFDLIPTILLWIIFKQNSQRYSEPYQAVFDESGMFVQRQNAKYE